MSEKTFGAYFKRLRREKLKMSLRQFAAEKGFDPGNISKIERGKLAPPKGKEVLERYAEALELEEGTDEWLHFFDLAAATRGEIPDELMADEEVVAHLPVLFRSLRGERVSKENLEKLLEMIRRA